MNGSLAHLHERLRTGYWLIPSVMVLASIGLAELMLWADESRPTVLVRATSWISAPRPEGSRNVLAAIAASMITVAATVFSITMLTLSSASQQFGPRVLRTFMRDRWNQVTLGTFTGTFVYSLMVLRTAGHSFGDEFSPHLSVSTGMLLALLSVGVLVMFIHHVSRSIQAPHMIAALAAELHEQIAAFYPDTLGEGSDEPPTAAIPPHTPRVLHFTRSGYIDAISDKPLAAAAEHGLTIRLLVQPGEYVIDGQPCAQAWPAEKVTNRAAEMVIDGFIIAQQRTPAQDPAYLFGQLAEIAARSLSPGINDPFTAVTCIDHLAGACVALARRRIPDLVRTSEDKRGRLITTAPMFPDLLAAAFGPIIEYGARHTLVVRRLALVLARIANVAERPPDRAAATEQIRILRTLADQQLGDDPRWPALRSEIDHLVAEGPQASQPCSP